jgi:hypothetical protein
MQKNDKIIEYDFSEIEPYPEEKVNDALLRMLANPVFQEMLDYLFPKEAHAKLRHDLSKAQSSLEFQKLFMYTGLKSVLRKTTPKGMSVENTHYVADGRPVSYVANHRDILLDSALLQVVLVDLGLETSEISFGSNLNVSGFINDFGRINRMFTVFREGSPRELLQNAQNLSAYIRHTLENKKRSIWIAHRKGRTKNGLDKTDLGVLKMLISCHSENIRDALKSLDIVPISVSYEWEPCDVLKVRELYFNEKGGYTKEADEDIHSVIGGITGQKGGINLAFCQPVNEMADSFELCKGKNPFLNQVISFMDDQIIAKYKLWPSNYYAFDLGENSNRYSHLYTQETKDIFEERLNKCERLIGEKNDRIRDLFLDIYANPVRAKSALNL